MTTMVLLQWGADPDATNAKSETALLLVSPFISKSTALTLGSSLSCSTASVSQLTGRSEIICVCQ